MNDTSATTNFIQNTTVTTKTPIIAGFDDFMNWLVHEGIPGVAGRAGDFLASGLSQGASIIDRVESGLKLTDTAPESQIARSQQIEAPEKTPQISQDIVASAKDATISIPAVQVADVTSHNFSPTATPQVGYGMQQGAAIG